MVINENNSYINTFTAGMNSDSAYDLLDNKHYVYGKNIRITKNLLLGGYNDYATQHEGIVTPVLNGISIGSIKVYSEEGYKEDIRGNILAVDSVDRLCTIVTCDNKSLLVYRLFINEETDKATDAVLLWEAEDFWEKGEQIPDKLSTVLYKELENVVKLYIATGKVPMIILRVDEQTELQQDTPLDCVINNRIIPQNRVYIDDIISGRLKTQQVQYTYRLYNKYATTTQLAPLTNKIQVIDNSRSKETGNAENTETSLGFKLVIKKDKYWDYFNRIQVYRLSYIKPGEPAEVNLIYDDKLPNVELPNKGLIINDVGIEPLQTLTIEEFAAMSGLILVPQVIELNQNYMFCGNVKDDTILKDISFINNDNTFTEVKADVVISDGYNGIIPQKTSDKFVDTKDFLYTKYFDAHDVNPNLALSSYDNIITSSLLRSLRRGEQYKYAIVLYDKYGRRTDVHKLGEITVAEIDPQNNMPFSIEENKVIAHPVGLKIHLPKIDVANSKNYKDIIGCQIVRRSSSDVYQKTLLQVALAKPVNQGLLLTTLREKPKDAPTKYSPYYPTGFLGVNDLTISPTYYWELQAIDGVGILGVTQSGLMYASDDFKDYWAKMRADNLFLIFSSEIDYRRDDVLSRLSTSGMKISEVYYIPSLYKLHGASEELDTFYGLYGEEGLHDGVTEEYERVDVVAYDSTLVSDSFAYYTVPTSQLLRNEDIKIIMLQNGSNTEPALGWTLGVYAGQFDGNMEHLGTKICDVLTSTDGNVLLNSTFADALRSNEYLTLTSDRGSGAYEIQFILYKQKQSDESTDTEEQTDGLYIRRYLTKPLSTDEKTNEYWVFNYFKLLDDIQKRHSEFGLEAHDVKYIKDVKIPNWEEGFSNIQRNSDLEIQTAIKQYKQFTTGIDQYTYNNWCSFGKYDLRAGIEPQPNVATEGGLGFAAEFLSTSGQYNEWVTSGGTNGKREVPTRYGYIGPGGSCFLLTTEDKDPGEFQTYTDTFYTSICNIRHNPKLDNVESDEVTQYFGFGNYFKVSIDENGTIRHDGNESVIVFDGDVYITPHEFTTMYKTYNFESVDTLLSTQITAYVPLESKVNTFFDYGMNLRNTTSANLMNEPGSIDGVDTQDRPAHQYNMIYSDNDTSNDVFTLISTDKNETNQFKQRAYFSEPKTNGEFIDNFPIFKAASFIDVDSQYGQLTNMDTDRNNLYYWQDHAFGKFSVNERSLINDTNGNTIMLGQAGILSRYDYLSTKYGMRLYDFCSRTTENGLFWVDINNKAVVGSAQNGVVNYGEQLFVLNLINNAISSDKVPYVDYDILNNELLCKCLNDGEQIIFNTKYNIATSIYSREYDNIAYIKNHIFGIYNNNLYRFNYIKNKENQTFLTPIALHFVVNPNTSITKVFDSQQIVPIKRSTYLPDIVNSTNMKFETDMYNATYVNMNDVYTDREGNIIYNIPRFGQREYGNRLRGKWMKVEMTNNNQSQYTSISHVITKFRQSFS